MEHPLKILALKILLTGSTGGAKGQVGERFRYLDNLSSDVTRARGGKKEFRREWKERETVREKRREEEGVSGRTRTGANEV